VKRTSARHLIEMSSLGSPVVRSLRHRTSPETRTELMRRVRAPRVGDLGDQRTKSSHTDGGAYHRRGEQKGAWDMQIEAAMIQEQGVKFAVVIVKKHVIQQPSQRVAAQEGFARLFPGVPIVLMAQDARGIPTYWGRDDIVKFLANTELSRIPWRRYTFN
jgi:hypothetical protein